MPRPIITLTTDFGLKDPYVSEMKAVILGINPEVTIVDVSHTIEKFDVRMAAYVLASASSYFPKGTIHVAVVDPGVGTRRRPIVVQTKHSVCVGPDNGILSLIVTKQGAEKIYEITNKKLMMPRISNTFHGRDIFAPVSAHLSNGIPPSRIGPRIERIQTPSFAKLVKFKGKLVGEIIHVDDFGNIVTNIQAEMIESIAQTGTVTTKLGDVKMKLRLYTAYADARKKEAIGMEAIGIIGSHDFLEIAVNQGNASKALRAQVGSRVEVYLR